MDAHSHPSQQHSQQLLQQPSSSSASFASGSGSGSSHARRLSNPLMAFLSATAATASSASSPSPASVPASPHRSPAQVHSPQQSRPAYQQMLRHLRHPGHSQHDLDASGTDRPSHSHTAEPMDPETGILAYDDDDEGDSHDDMADEDDMHSDPDLMMLADDDEDEASGVLGLFGFGGFSGGGGGAARRNPGSRPISGSSMESQPTTATTSSSGAASAGLGPVRIGQEATVPPPSVQVSTATSAAGGAPTTTQAAASASTATVAPSGPPTVAGIAVLGGPFPALRDWIVVTTSQLPFPIITNLGQVNENTINWLNPIVYLQLLTYPAGAAMADVQSSAVGSQGNLTQRSGSGSKASFSVLRETHLVRQRRRLVFMLSTYTIIMRYCSFDAFVVLLVLSTCLLLYFMKNSRKINVQMAKRNIKQRVGWAKQWAGGLFKRNNNNNNNNANTGEEGDNFMGSAEGGVAFGHETASAAGTSASPNVASEKKRRRGIPGFKKNNSPSNSTNTIATTSGSNGPQAMLAPSVASGPTASASSAHGNPGGGAAGSGTGAAAAAKAAAGARRINNLFRRAASVEPTGDKINPFHADGTANVAAVMGSGLSSKLHGSNSGSSDNVDGPIAIAPTATGTSSTPAPGSVTGSMAAALGVPTPEAMLHSTGSVEGGVSHSTGGGSGTGGKLSKIFSRRRGNSSVPTPSSSSAPTSSVTGGMHVSSPPPVDDVSWASQQPTAREASSETLANTGVVAAPSNHGSNSVLSSSDTLGVPHAHTSPAASSSTGVTQPNPIIVHTHTSAQPITVLSQAPWSATAAPPGSAPIIPTSVSHDSISGLVSLGGGSGNPTSGSSDSVQSNSSGGSGTSGSSNKRLGGLQGHARSSSDGQYAVLPPTSGRTLTNASTTSSSGSVKSGGRIAAAMVGKAKDLWGHVKGGHGSGGTTPALPESPASGRAPSSRSGSLTDVVPLPMEDPLQPTTHPPKHSHALPGVPARKPSLSEATPMVSPAVMDEGGSGGLRKTPSRSSVTNATTHGADSGARQVGLVNADDHTPTPPLPQV